MPKMFRFWLAVTSLFTRSPAPSLGRVLDPYRPELYYMRGPGPKWREKHPHDTARLAQLV
jgi:hypothetical protein